MSADEGRYDIVVVIGIVVSVDVLPVSTGFTFVNGGKIATGLCDFADEFHFAPFVIVDMMFMDANVLLLCGVLVVRRGPIFITAVPLQGFEP